MLADQVNVEILDEGDFSIASFFMCDGDHFERHCSYGIRTGIAAVLRWTDVVDIRRSVLRHT